jgi:chromosome partitioning protein
VGNERIWRVDAAHRILAAAGLGAVHGPRRIAFINEKGGSAKTTLVASVAAYLALRRGRRVLAIDMDPQGQLGKVLGVDQREPTRTAIDLLLDSVLGDPSLDRAAPSRTGGSHVLPTVRSRIPGLDVIVANKSLGLYPGWSDEDESDPTRRLADTLEASAELGRYEFVLFDAPPSFGPLTLNVLRAANEVVVPVPLTYLALDGCAELVRTITTVRERYDHESLKITMVVPTFYRRTKMAHEILEKLKQRFPKEIAHTVVGYHVKIDEAQSRGLSIFEYAPRDRGAEVMAELAEELELRQQAPGVDTPEGAPHAGVQP